MRHSKSILILLLLLSAANSTLAQLATNQKETLFEYYRNNSNFSQSYDEIAKIIDNADAEQIGKFSQCANAMIDIKDAGFFAYFLKNDNNPIAFLRGCLQGDTIFTQGKTSILKKLLPSFSEGVLRNFEDQPYLAYSNMNFYHNYENVFNSINLQKCVDEYISRQSQEPLTYYETATMIQTFYVLYPQEMEILEKAVNKEVIVENNPANRDSLMFYYFASKMNAFLLNEMHDNAEKIKESAENDLVFCDRMMTKLLTENKSDEDISKGSLFEEFEVTNTKPEKYKTKAILESGVCYLIEASGEVSDWTGHTDGVDPMFGYAQWRWPDGVAKFGQLRVNGYSLEEISGQTLSYNSSHVYTVTVTGDGRSWEFYSSDAQGSEGDNEGKFLVKIYTCR
jgi:hypothetical protein